MARTVMALIVAVIASVALSPVAGAEAGGPAPAEKVSAAGRCGSMGPFLTNIRSTRVPCKKARSIAREWSRRLESDNPVVPTMRVQGFRCVPDLPKVTCRHGRKTVTWDYGF